MNVFDDQVGSPTWTGSLAQVIANALDSDAYGTFHACDRGVVSRFEQAQIICQMAGMGTDHLAPVSTATVSLPAKRPAFSALDADTLPTPDWRESLQQYLHAMLPVLAGHSAR